MFTLYRILDGTIGDLKCSSKDQSTCKLAFLGKDPTTGDFIANYQDKSGFSNRLLRGNRRL